MLEMRGIDISNWQAGLKISNHLDQIGFCICKATEGVSFVDRYCDPWVQTLRAAGKPWGFYHFGGNDAPQLEADFYIRSCSNYFGEGVPILDWEGTQTVEWVNAFVRRVHDETGVWPWIYANPWRFNQGGVEPNCMRWIASYLDVLRPPLDYELPSIPDTDGLVGAWQFCSDGRLSGYAGDLDFNVFYGDAGAWRKYAAGERVEEPGSEQELQSTIFENNEMRVEVTIK